MSKHGVWVKKKLQDNKDDIGILKAEVAFLRSSIEVALERTEQDQCVMFGVFAIASVRNVLEKALRVLDE